MLEFGLAVILAAAQPARAPEAVPLESSRPAEVEGVTVTGGRTPHPDTVYCVRDLQRAASRIKPTMTCERHEVWTIYREKRSQEATRNYAAMTRKKSFIYSMSTDLIDAALLMTARDEAAHRRDLRLQASMTNAAETRLGAPGGR